MTPEDFELLTEQKFFACKELLKEKAKEYAIGNDRLMQFKQAAKLKGEHPIESLIGMWTKHITSIYQLAAQESKGIQCELEMWDEKLNDSINYHVLLKGLIVDCREEA